MTAALLGGKRTRLIYAGLTLLGVIVVWAVASGLRSSRPELVDAGQMMRMRLQGGEGTPAGAGPVSAFGGMGARGGGMGGGARAGSLPVVTAAPTPEGRSQQASAGFEFASPSSPWPTAPMRIQTASLSLRVDDVSKAQQRIGALARAAGGYVADSDATADGHPEVGTITIRVPSFGLDSLVDRIAALGKLLSRKVESQEVTQEYVDLSSRRRNLEREELRLLDLLNRAGRVRDLLEVEQQVGRVRGEIETIAGRLRYLANRVELSTVQVQLAGPQPVVQHSGSAWTARDEVRQAGASLLASGRALAALGIWVGMFAPIWLPVVLAAIWLARRPARQTRPVPAGTSTDRGA